MRKISPVVMALVAIFALVSVSSLASAQTKKSTTRRAAPLIPVGTNLKIRINDTLSSKENRIGDRFTATVIDPSRFDEATVTGHISSIQKSGKVKGRTSMNLAFDSVQLRDGRRGVLHERRGHLGVQERLRGRRSPALPPWRRMRGRAVRGGPEPVVPAARDLRRRPPGRLPALIARRATAGTPGRTDPR